MHPRHNFSTPRGRSNRGSLLVTAMLFATVIALGLAGYINVSRTTLRLAQRTFYVNDAASLAEAGLEEAMFCYRQAAAGTATAWSDWTLDAGNATRTLPTFNRSQNAVGTVK